MRSSKAPKGEMMMTQEEFAKLSKPEQRVAIAKDVIERLQSRTMKAASFNGYVVSDAERIEKIAGEGSSPITPDDTKNISRKCTVCALGGAMISAISLGNGVTWDQFYDIGGAIGSSFYGLRSEFCIERRGVTRLLRKYFTAKQMEIIEAAFETSYAKPSERPQITQRSSLRAQAYAFGMQFRYDNDRLMAIMQNIVDHDGDFVPSDLDYEIVYVTE